MNKSSGASTDGTNSHTAKERVLKRHPAAGAQLSAMHGWRIVDYTRPETHVYLNRGCKTEAAAWRSVAYRRGYRK